MVYGKRMVTPTEQNAQQYTRNTSSMSDYSVFCATEEDRKWDNSTSVGQHGGSELPVETRRQEAGDKQTCAGNMGTMSGKRHRDPSPACSRRSDDKRLRLSIQDAQEAIRMDASQGHIPIVGENVGPFPSASVCNTIQQSTGTLHLILEGSKSHSTRYVESDMAPELLRIPIF
eukprot:TRINITY_DN4431_c1_g1_i1.p2 TRINITY_DN4431_c1_g1~~TRINITY_DN4431_c1_g1_i1.p2  ORF type:complete len:173 (-),score=25.97 TRINITY_DN4431_c1_g1_i1:85-603(-)